MDKVLAGLPEDYPLVYRWPVAPGIRAEGDFLLYDRLPQNPAELRYAKRPRSRLLSDFVGLAEAPAAQIEAYAQQWGVLGLCRHGVPAGVVYGYGYHADNLPPGQWICPEARREPLERWRALARIFGGHVDNIEHSRNNPAIRRQTVAQINHFAASFGHLRPVVVPVGKDLALRLAGSLAVAGLAAALGYQLMIALTGGYGWLVCAECQDWFQPDTRRSPNRNAYCRKCGRAAAMRAANRRAYLKRKLQGER